jgi:hypothetical protein
LALLSLLHLLNRGWQSLCLPAVLEGQVRLAFRAGTFLRQKI